MPRTGTLLGVRPRTKSSRRISSGSRTIKSRIRFVSPLRSQFGCGILRYAPASYGPADLCRPPFPSLAAFLQVDKRRNVPEYLSVLMECKVSADSKGVYFDSTHPAWTRLVHIVAKADQAEKEARAAAEAGGPAAEAARAARSSHILTPLPAVSSSGEARIQAELAQRPVNETAVRKLCMMYGVPQRLRPDVWAVLLGEQPLSAEATSTATSTSTASLSSPACVGVGGTDAAGDVALDMANQRVVKVDVLRTLPHAPYFALQSVQDLMENLLTAYCKRRHITYKQGLNYLLAPFFIARVMAHVPPLDHPMSGAEITAAAAAAAASATGAGAAAAAGASPAPVTALFGAKDQMQASFGALVERMLPNTFTDTGTPLPIT